MITAEQASLLRAMSHPACGGTLHNVDLNDPVVQSLIAENLVYVNNDFDDRVFDREFRQWLQITTEGGRVALAEYDAHFVTVPRAALKLVCDRYAESADSSEDWATLAELGHDMRRT